MKAKIQKNRKTERQKDKRTNLKLIGHIGVCPPVSEVIQTLLSAAKDSSLNQPDADHGSSPALYSKRNVLVLLVLLD